MTKKRRIRSRILLLLACVLIAVLAFSMTACDAVVDYLGDLAKDPASNEQSTTDDTSKLNGDEIYFHFIDVGQGDAILITTPQGNMLVDTSISGKREQLKAYLDQAGVTSLEYLVLTHPDADHIGNADYIIENYNIKTVLLSGKVSTSKTYERMLDALEKSSAEVIVPEPGYVFELGGLKNMVLAPLEDYKDANEMSIVIRSVYGENAVMLTGDAEHGSEEDIVSTYGKEALKCDILKMGHHGSRTSSTAAFLKLVDPTYAVISCGKGNTYGHPHQETLDQLNQMNIKVYRTDMNGTIVFKTNGTTLTLVEK